MAWGRQDAEKGVVKQVERVVGTTTTKSMLTHECFFFSPPFGRKGRGRSPNDHTDMDRDFKKRKEGRKGKETERKGGGGHEKMSKEKKKKNPKVLLKLGGGWHLRPTRWDA